MLPEGGWFFAQPSRPLPVEGGVPPQEKGLGEGWSALRELVLFDQATESAPLCLGL
jgi:hypothetical protein